MAEQNLNQTDLSNLTGIGKSSLSQYLSGKNTPHRRRVAEIATALGVSPGRLNITFREECEASETISNQKVSIEETARRLGKSQQFVRIALQNGTAPFGFSTKGAGSTYALLLEEDIRRDQIYFVEKDKCGKSELYALTDFIGVRKDSKLLKQYFMGTFGATPKLQSYLPTTRRQTRLLQGCVFIWLF